jgi:hypothetical protein
MTEDRWEAFGDYDDDIKFNEGVKHERERILDLPLMHEGWGGKHRSEDCVTCDNIALIKGEN